MKTNSNTVLITGGSSGIGLELAKRFLQLNNRVIITGRDESKLARIKEAFPGIKTIPGDLTDQATLDRTIADIEAHYPDLNILINNAAVQFNYELKDEPDVFARIDYEVAANLLVPVKLTAGLLPLLLKNPNSAVVNVSSGLFIAPKRSASVYCATKAAMHSFSKTLRYQLEETNVQVFEIIPALTDTPMTRGRGKSKMTAGQLTDEFMRNFQRNRYESYIGKTKLLKRISRLFPQLADRIMKNGL